MLQKLKYMINNIRYFFYFGKRCMIIGYDYAYREHVYNKFVEFSDSELQLYYQILVSDLESRLTYMSITGLFLFITSLIGFIITTLLKISSKSFGFYLTLFSFVLGVVYWKKYDHSILMDIFFLLLGALSATLLISTILDGIKKSVIIKKLIIEDLLNKNRYLVRLPKKYRI